MADIWILLLKVFFALFWSDFCKVWKVLDLLTMHYHCATKNAIVCLFFMCMIAQLSFQVYGINGASITHKGVQGTSSPFFPCLSGSRSRYKHFHRMCDTIVIIQGCDVSEKCQRKTKIFSRSGKSQGMMAIWPMSWNCRGILSCPVKEFCCNCV